MITEMKNTTLACVLACVVLAMGGCREARPGTQTMADVAMAMGDSTLYGLACDGCNDTIIVFLHAPYDGSDPDTLNILEASSRHRVFGNVRIGDRLAIVRDRNDSTRADRVIVTQDLIGQWCYKVKPVLRERAGMRADSAGEYYGIDADSLEALLSEEREYGLSLKIDSVAMSIGSMRQPATEEDSPVEFPKMKHYRRWCISNGHLLLTQARPDTLGHDQQEQTDTAELVMLTADTLVLLFADGEHGYYRKVE